MAMLGGFLTGRQTEEALLAAVKNASDAEAQRLRQCQGTYYAGVVRLLAGDRAGARELFRQCADTGQTLVTEFCFAKGEETELGGSEGDAVRKN
jgi:hypothetical protein